jgi:hypothetical protein
MENFYTCYTKVIQDKTYYFVKRYLRFPEYNNVADILEGYGMHIDFNKACSIAGIKDAAIRKQILDDMERSLPYAKVIELKNVNFETRSISL